MNNFFFCLEINKNIHLHPNDKSEPVSDLIYGEKFKILNKKNNWYKIKTTYDNYIGYIKIKKFTSDFHSTHKTNKLKSKIYKKVGRKFLPTQLYLSFSSKIQKLSFYGNFVKFEKNKWIKKSDINQLNYKTKNFKKIFKLFLNTKYKWGGKSYKGLDCSALLQMFFYFNNEFCPRDTVKQIPFFKTNLRIKKKYRDLIKKIIFWKGHVAIKINKKELIHAYGPKKKVVIMKKDKTLNKINNDTGLKPIYI